MNYSSSCIKVLDLEGRLLEMDEDGQQLLGIDDFEAFRGLYWPDFWKGGDREAALVAIATARAGKAARFTGFFTTLYGSPKWWDVVVTPLPGETGTPSKLLAVSRDITEQRRSEGYFRFLADIGTSLDGSLDSDETLRDIADAIVRTVADYCLFDMIDGDGRVRRVVSAHRNEVPRDVAQRLMDADPVGTPDRPVAIALRTRKPVVVRENDGTGGGGEEIADLRHALGITTIITVPMMRGNQAIGTLSLASGRGYDYDERDVSLAEEIGRRVASSLLHARRYERELLVATTLQAAAIPRRLPIVRGLSFDAIYVPASTDATVGGDWYDAFEIADGRVVLTIGDVMGHGLGAAVTMGAIRQSMRAAAMMQAEPTRILDTADRTLRLDDVRALATALVAVLDRETLTLSCALAGHPLPVLLRDGTVSSPFAPGGLMLGLRTPFEPPAQQIALQAGDLIAFVTDGILEQSRDIRAGERALAEAIARPEVYRSERPARTLHEALLLGETSDDVAILTLRIT
ncbi:MAG: SpoIIE family protein phosphatase [Candidatus Eremiobacteraeota bacterium]|nr:SpoIIE family protein phosphatase [Candidatus Eremiobacteraeota bacterium]